MSNNKTNKSRISTSSSVQNKNSVKNFKTSEEITSSCSFCHELLEKRTINCICCLKKFHLECAGINRIEIKNPDIKNQWICSSDCGAKTNSTLDKPVRLNSNKNYIALEDLETQIKNLIDFQEQLSKKYDELVLLNQKISKEISEIKKENNDLKVNHSSSLSLAEINNEINCFKQFNIRNHIVIKGIKFSKSDKPLEIFMRLVNFLNAEVYEADIEKAFIQENFNSNSATLFVCFFEYRIKKVFINSRQGRRITPNDISTSGQNFIIIEDQLTKENSKLLKETKVVLKRYKFKFIWVRDGKICFRFDETRPYFLVNSLSHLREIEKDILDGK